MKISSVEKLYTPEILGLAVGLSEYPLTGEYQYSGEARSKACGSVVTAGFNLNGGGSVVQLGLQVTACAIGQASASIFASAAQGLRVSEIEKAHWQIEAWLQGNEEPDWPQFSKLRSARAHRGRHGAIILPWTAALNALCRQA